MRTFFALAAALALAACQDPAGVGLGLIDEEGVDPEAYTVAADSVATLAQSPTAIGFADASATSYQSRVLVGRVEDPVFGDAAPVAYLDLAQPTIDEDLEASDVSQVWLELRRTYVYGDTTATLPLTLRPINGTWQADTSYPADTLFDTGAPLVTTQATPADTLVRWDLPPSWVTANAGTLLGDDFGTAFEGFALNVDPGAGPQPGAVLGFATLRSQGSGLRVVAAEDTLFFSLAEVFTSMQGQPPVAAPPSLLPSRAYSTRGVTLAFDTAQLPRAPLARALLTLPLDRSTITSGTFVRPVAAQSSVYGVRGAGDDEERVYLGELVVATEGDARVTTSSVLTRRLQEVLLGAAEPFDRYEVTTGESALATVPISLNVLPVLLQPGDSGPRLALTLVGGSPGDQPS